MFVTGMFTGRLTAIMALVRAMRGLVHDAGEVQSWPRFLDIHLAGLRAAASLP